MLASMDVYIVLVFFFFFNVQQVISFVFRMFALLVEISVADCTGAKWRT